MKVVVCEPGKMARMADIDGGLESMQEMVGGLIEAIYPYEDPVALVCNEEGKLLGLPLCRGIQNEDGKLVDIIAGTFIVTGLDEFNFADLSDELLEKYLGMFALPEAFFKFGNEIVAMPSLYEEEQNMIKIFRKTERERYVQEMKYWSNSCGELYKLAAGPFIPEKELPPMLQLAYNNIHFESYDAPVYLVETPERYAVAMVYEYYDEPFDFIRATALAAQQRVLPEYCQVCAYEGSGQPTEPGEIAIIMPATITHEQLQEISDGLAALGMYEE